MHLEARLDSRSDDRETTAHALTQHRDSIPIQIFPGLKVVIGEEHIVDLCILGGHLPVAVGSIAGLKIHR